MEESELSDFLAEDDELNHTDLLPTKEKASYTNFNPDVEVRVPANSCNAPNHLHMDNDSVSTFLQGGSMASQPTHTSTIFQPGNFHTPSTQSSSTPRNPSHTIQFEDDGSVSKLSDTASRISDLESNLADLSMQMKRAFREFRQESRRTLLLKPHLFPFWKCSRITSCHRLSAACIADYLKQAYIDYYEKKKSHLKLREDASLKLADAMATSGNQKKETILKQLISQERQQTSARESASFKERLPMAPPPW